MKILIFGAGGVGSVLGAFLARTGHDVSLLGRAWHLDVIERRGLSVTGIWGDYRMKAFDLYRDASEVAAKKAEWDLILLTVKSFDTERAISQILPLMTDKTVLLSLQNGLGNIETILAGGVRPENYLAARIIFGVEIEPGLARVTVNADDVRIGALPGATPRLSAFQMAQILNTAKIPAQGVPDILTWIWQKVIYNCALNPICTLHEMTYGRILERDETRAQMERVIRECYAVAAAKGIRTDPADPEAFIGLMVKKWIPSTASHTPSMLQDIRRGKRTDIGALNGAIARYAMELGMSVPENEILTSRIQAIEGRSQDR